MGRPPSLAPTAGRALPERTAIRHALDDLTARRPPMPSASPTRSSTARSRQSGPPDVTAWCRRAAAEYLAPAPDPVAAAVDGCRPQDS
ncbi:hypothetical protein [Nonomuraea maheshkhaliensis]|uniref:hypothetical protein n=1 Tax=Nonomuraea maheshkhaliensis TaxID=419590 RepID=UPI0031F991DF